MRRIVAAILVMLLMTLSFVPLCVFAVENIDTPDYKVAFFSFDCFNMQDQNGKRSGYGYEMMQNVSRYLQCTFSYVGYEKTAAECEEMLKNGELDLYTAAKKTPERQKNYVFSTHPSITSYTCMNVKVGNTKIIAGDYSTYNGIRVGLLERHTYNGMFIDFVKAKGVDCEVVYYETPTELANALVDDDVDAVVNSYIRIPEDERTIENFGETPYYIMARKENQELINQIDAAIDSINIETPNWRTEMYNKYYGTIDNNLELTQDEKDFLNKLKENGTTIRAAVNPDNRPYSWYEDGETKGILVEIFKETVKELGLKYKIVPTTTKKEYKELVKSGDVDVWIDMDGRYDYENDGGVYYKPTNVYLAMPTSVLRTRSSSEKIDKLIVFDDCISMREIYEAAWPKAKITVANSLAECKKQLTDGNVDGALLFSYAAQCIAQDDLQNRLRVDIVPDGSMDITMGVNSNSNIHFYGLWKKTLSRVSSSVANGIVQEYLEKTVTPSMLAYFYDHPISFVIMFSCVALLLILMLLYLQSSKSKKKLEKSAADLAVALRQAEEATYAKQNFFSKMSHDIRTPLNVVLGMTQIAQKYKDNPDKLDNALKNVTKEGNYLLVLINSILDVNQLEHGTVELTEAPFNPADCLNESAYLLKTLADNKHQKLTVISDCNDRIVIGDENRLKQIIINILSNAIKYTDNDGHIELKMECLPDNRYRFTCTDDGIGMSEEFIAHICDDYTRAEDSRISKIQGTGLGMSVVKGFTDVMGGTLTIKSKFGVGSTFAVELPFRAASAKERETLLHPLVVSDDDAKNYIGKKILLAEDNSLNAEIATELMKSIGLEVDWAENGECCVRRFEASENNEYFAVFMDMQMPVMDGVTATKLIRKSTRTDRNIPIFALTANTFADDRRSCREAGMNGYVTKPISLMDIKKALFEIKNI